MSARDFKEWVGRVENGKMPLWIWDAIQKMAPGYEGKNLIVTIREQKRKRSLNLNAFYWGFVVEPIMQMLRHAGNNYDLEDTHEFLKAEVGRLSQVLVLPDGEVKKTPGSTKKMTGSEMVLYIEKIRAWAAEFGLEIAFPNEYPDR